MSDYPLRGQIWWADLEPVKGSEQGGSRPVLVISNNLMNKVAPIIIIVPMTRSQEKVKVGPFNQPFKYSDIDIDHESLSELESNGLLFAPKDGALLCNQVRAINKSRLIGKIGTFKTTGILKTIQFALSDSLGFNACDSCGFPLRPNALTCQNCYTIQRLKCTYCGNIMELTAKYCSECGEGLASAESDQ